VLSIEKINAPVMYGDIIFYVALSANSAEKIQVSGVKPADTYRNVSALKR
jgi:hypothetical protein